MNASEKDCYDYFIKLAKELADNSRTDYEFTKRILELDLAEGIASDWAEAREKMNLLKASGCIPKEKMNIIEELVYDFAAAFEEYYTQERICAALLRGGFWLRQRESAKQLLELDKQK